MKKNRKECICIDFTIENKQIYVKKGVFYSFYYSPCFFCEVKKENTCTWPFYHGLSMLLLYTHLLTLIVLLDLTSRTLINIMLIQVSFTSQFLGTSTSLFSISVYIFYYTHCKFCDLSKLKCMPPFIKVLLLNHSPTNGNINPSFRS